MFLDVGFEIPTYTQETSKGMSFSRSLQLPKDISISWGVRKKVMRPYLEVSL
jgi:hypothetical protein